MSYLKEKRGYLTNKYKTLDRGRGFYIMLLLENNNNIMIKERWKSIPWYEWYYEISDFWRKRSLDIKYEVTCKRRGEFVNKSPWRILKWQVNVWWYNTVTFSKNNKQKNLRVARLVAQAFCDNPEWKEFVNHIDWNKLNDHYTNLEWCTRSENELHAYRTGLKNGHKKPMFWEENPMYWIKRWDNHFAKKVWQYDLKWTLIEEFDCILDASDKTWASKVNISNVCRGYRGRKTCGWFKWKFL